MDFVPDLNLMYKGFLRRIEVLNPDYAHSSQVLSRDRIVSRFKRISVSKARDRTSVSSEDDSRSVATTTDEWQWLEQEDFDYEQEGRTLAV